jgi:hypothetical protein
MAGKKPEGGGFGRGSNGKRGGGGGKPIKPVKQITDLKSKKPLTAAQLKQRKAEAKKKAEAIPENRREYGPVQKFGMLPPKTPTKPTVKSTIKKGATTIKNGAKSPKTGYTVAGVGVTAGYAKLRANDKAQQQKMINIKKQWEKSAARRAGMTLNDYIKKYGK